MDKNEQTIRRRTFLSGTVAAIASPCIVPASVLGKAAASKRLSMGMIGLGSMGMRHVEGFLQEDDCRIVAVCDVDASRRRAAIEGINKHHGSADCAQYNDFRELIGRGDIDTLCISVPDHWHAVIALEGVRAGKDIYGEKPLTLTVPEGRVLVDEVNRYGCVWQTGSWQRSTAHFRFGCELVRNNRIGKLQKVEVGIGPGFKSPTEPTVDRIEPQPVQPV